MPSAALTRWESTARRALDEIENAHSAVEGKKGKHVRRGRRYLTLQLNHAYAVLVSSQFQGFCRDLHSEAVDAIARATIPPDVAGILRLVLTQGRKLDAGNPNPGNIGSDFARLGLDLWKEVDAKSALNAARQEKLERLNTWRNAIAHQDWSKVGASSALQLRTVKQWRAACHALARAFDAVVKAQLHALTGAPPW